MPSTFNSPNGTVLYLSGEMTYDLVSNYVGDPPAVSTMIFANHCLIKNEKTKSGQLHLHTASLCVMRDGANIDCSGKNGSAAVTMVDPTSKGVNGCSVVISTSRLELSAQLAIKALGGDGGQGLPSRISSEQPGAGGDSGNGGDALLLVRTEYDDLADRGDKIVADYPTTATEQNMSDMLVWSQLAQLVTTSTANDELSWTFKTEIDQDQPDMDPAGVLPYKVNAHTFLGLISSSITYLRQMSRIFVSDVDCRPGVPGSGGIKKETSSAGPRGKSGTEGSVRFLTWNAANILNSENMLFHPEQVRLTMVDIQNQYYIGSLQTIKEAATRLDELIGRLSPLDGIEAGHALYKAYASQEAATLAVLPAESGQEVPTSVALLKSSLASARQYRIQIDQAYDYYRHSSTWVPRGSYSMFETALENVLADFSGIEKTYEDYQTALKDENARKVRLELGQKAAVASQKLCEEQSTVLETELVDTANLIAKIQDQVPSKHQAVNQALLGLADKIKTNVEWPTMQDFLGAMGQMAFCPEPQMAGVQAATLLTNSVNQVRDDSGVAVNKDYIVSQMRVLAGEISGLKDAVKISSEDPTLDVEDPGAAKLLGKETDIMDLVDKYRSALGSDLDAFRALFDDYVDTMIQRNNAVIRYNSLITLLLQTRAKLTSVEIDQATLGSQEAALMNSDIPALTNVVTSSYLEHTSKVLELLYDTQRAMRFWTLDSGPYDLGGLRDQGFPSNGLGTKLAIAKGDIVTAFTTATNNLSVGRQPFGVTGGSAGLAKTIALNRYQLERLRMPVNTSRIDYSVTVQVPVARKKNSIDENVFASNADVRISTIRVYIEGVKTQDDILNVRVEHMGTEQFITVRDVPLTFSHDSIVQDFEYNLATKAISRDIDMSVDEKTYGLPGPFTTWKITLSPTNNKGLDVSGIRKAWIEFSGYSRSFV